MCVVCVYIYILYYIRDVQENAFGIQLMCQRNQIYIYKKICI